MKTIKACVKAIAISTLGLGLMGNQGCEQPPAAEQGPRLLKWYADAGRIKSQPIQFGNSGSFDFGYVASEQLYGVLSRAQIFTTSHRGPDFVQGRRGVELAGAQKMYQELFGSTEMGDYTIYQSDEARCLIKLPDYRIYGSVLSYEMVSNSNIMIGFNQNQTHGGFGLGAQFGVRVNNLSVQMYAALISKDMGQDQYNLITAPLANERSRDTDGKVNIGLNQIGLGYSWYNNTPLSTITERALSKGVADMKNEILKTTWSTKILDIRDAATGGSLGDTGYIVKGGHNINLKKGDQLHFFEDQTMWSGKPCESDFYGYSRRNRNPIAVGEVAHVDNTVSTIVILKRYDGRDIKPGWRVELHKRVEELEAEKKAVEAQSAPKRRRR